MNRLTHLLVITLLLCIPALTYAQDDNDDEIIDLDDGQAKK